MQCVAVPCTAIKWRYYHEQWITGVQRTGEAVSVSACCVTVSSQLDVRAAVVSGKWHQHIVLLQVAAEGLRRRPGAAGVKLRGGDVGAAGGCRRCGCVRSDRRSGAGHS